MNDTKLKITLQAISACFLWSTAFVGVKIGLKYSPPLLLAGIRFTLAGLLLLPFCGSPVALWKDIKSNIKTILLTALFQTLGLYSLFTIGMTLVPGAVGAIIIGASPITTAIVTHFFVEGDRLTAKKTLKILLGVCGIFIVAISRNSGKAEWNLSELSGMGLLLIGTVSSAAGNIMVAGSKKQISPLKLNSIQLISGGVTLTILSLLLEKGFKASLDVQFFIAISYLAIISAVSFSLWFHLLKQPGVKVSDLNVWKFIIPVFGAINAWILLPNESPDLMSIAGMVVVGVSVVLVYGRKERNRGLDPI